MTALSRCIHAVAEHLYVQMVKGFSMDDFFARVRAVQAPALIIDQESSAPAGQSPPERMAAEMQVGRCLLLQIVLILACLLFCVSFSSCPYLLC